MDTISHSETNLLEKFYMHQKNNAPFMRKNVSFAFFPWTLLGHSNFCSCVIKDHAALQDLSELPTKIQPRVVHSLRVSKIFFVMPEVTMADWLKEKT